MKYVKNSFISYGSTSHFRVINSIFYRFNLWSKFYQSSLIKGEILSLIHRNTINTKPRQI